MSTANFYTIRQAAAFAGVDEAVIRLAIMQGELNAWRMPKSGDTLIRKSDLVAYLEKGRQSSE